MIKPITRRAWCFQGHTHASRLSLRLSHFFLATTVAAAYLLLFASRAWADDVPTLPLPDPSDGRSGPPDISFFRPNATGRDVITCSIRVDHPHNSTTHPGEMIVKALTSCSATVVSITQVMTMWSRLWILPDYPVAYGFPKTAGPTSSVGGFVSTFCVPGNYFGTADSVIIPPAGYFPPIDAIGGVGPVVPINC